jgi:hypothetical protein
MHLLKKLNLKTKNKVKKYKPFFFPKTPDGEGFYIFAGRRVESDQAVSFGENRWCFMGEN